MTDLQSRCDGLIRSFRQNPDASARTVLVTVFGDGVEPHGGEVWAGSLLRLVEPLGMNERLVRTSLNRLVGEGVLVTRRHGKRSFYSVTPLARREFRQAERRIYHPRGDPWDGQWTVVVNTSDVAPPARAAVRAHLGQLGFSPLGPSVHISPFDQVDALRRVLADLGLVNQLAVFRGQVPATVGLEDADLARLVSSELKGLEPAWRKFLRRFRPLADAVRDGSGRPELEPETAFLTQTLLVHAYRRIVLREPELPAGLWPPGWAGDAAYDVVARCYHALAEPAEAHLLAVCEAGGAPLLPLDPDYADRYPGQSRYSELT
ncbi:MAG TPA: PaaX family transcriptional regulator C-terminal domain-containing protein [Acidimicrobiia bacterium]|nr:PaaX family transcriptional regulator C-terminal domain-containing protein [Acidimicrobiia bacterium]